MSRFVVLWCVLLSPLARGADVELFSRSGCPHCADPKQCLAALAAQQPSLVVTIAEVDTGVAARARLLGDRREGIRVDTAPITSIVRTASRTDERLTPRRRGPAPARASACHPA